MIVFFSCFPNFNFLTKNLCLNSTEEKQGKMVWFICQWEGRESGSVGQGLANLEVTLVKTCWL